VNKVARITVEDCLGKINTRFELVHLAAARVRQLRKGAEPLVVCKNKDIVVSLREIAAEKVFIVDKEDTDSLQDPMEKPVEDLLPEHIDTESQDIKNGDQEATPEEK
jgi:DNA-directed RNA polymerase subunit omega